MACVLENSRPHFVEHRTRWPLHIQLQTLFKQLSQFLVSFCCYWLLPNASCEIYQTTAIKAPKPRSAPLKPKSYSSLKFKVFKMVTCNMSSGPRDRKPSEAVRENTEEVRTGNFNYNNHNHEPPAAVTFREHDNRPYIFNSNSNANLDEEIPMVFWLSSLTM